MSIGLVRRLSRTPSSTVDSLTQAPFLDPLVHNNSRPVLWIRQTGTRRAWVLRLPHSEDDDHILSSSSLPSSPLLPSQSDYPSLYSVLLRVLSLFPRLPPSLSRSNENPKLRSCSVEPNLPVTRKAPTGRKTAFETTERIYILQPFCRIDI